MRERSGRSTKWRANTYSASDQLPKSRRGNPGQLKDPGGVSGPVLVMRWALFIIVLLGFAWQFGYIKDVEVVVSEDSLDTLKVEELKTEALNKLNYFNRFKLFAPASSITQNMQKYGYVRSANVSISLLSPNLVVRLDLEEAAAILKNPEDPKSRILVSSNGVLYQQTGDKALDYLPVIEDATDLPKVSGTIITSPQVMSFIRQIDNEFRRLKLVSQERVYRVSQAPREVILLNPAWRYEVRLISDRAAADQAGELTQLLDWFKRHKITPNKFIDLRVDNTAYYR